MNSGHSLHVITDTDRRGAQVFATDLTAALGRRCQSARTVALAPGTHGAGLDVPALGPKRLSLATLRALRREIRAARVVVAHGSTTLLACALAGAWTGRPFVYRQISDLLFWTNSTSRRWRVRQYLRTPDVIVTLWAGEARVLRNVFGVDPSRIEVIPNGVPPERCQTVEESGKAAARQRLGLRPDQPTALYLGALVPEKGVQTLIAALDELDDWQLLIVGGGPMRAALQEQARDLGGRVAFAEPVQDPAEVYAAADVLVLPSEGGDSMPAVLIEAGMSALPAVATSIGGIVDIVLPGQTGELAPPAEPAALAAALRSVRLRSRELGEAAQEHCLRHFGIEVVAAQWDALLARLIAQCER